MEDLPLVPLFKVFSYLSLEERKAASDVCLAWNLGYEQYESRRKADSKAIRRYTIIKSSIRPVKKQLAHIVNHITKSTKSLRHLTVDLNMSRSAIRSHRLDYLSTLRRTDCTGQPERSQLHLDWIKGDHGSWGVVCDVFKILKQQRQNLRSVILRGFMMLPHLLRFPIGTLVKDTAGKLQELDIVNAADCKTGNRAFGIHRAQLYTYLPSFHGLRKLTLNFVWVSAEILLRVCQECHLLEFLGLELFPANQRSTLTAVHWAQARHILPHLQVCVTVHGASEAESHLVLSRFQPHMPPFAVVVHTKLE